MKTCLEFLKRLIILSCTFVTTAVFGQTTYVWTNQFPTLDAVAGDLGLATNWSPNGVPIPNVTDGITFGDEMRFDGRTTGPLIITGNSGPFSIQGGGAGSGQPYGLRMHLTSNQVAPVTIYSAISTSGGMRMNYFTIDAGSGGLNIGNNNTSNVLDILAGVLNGQILGFTNNSPTASVINPDVRWRLGGAGFHPFIFTGTGDWIVNNHMRSANSAALGVQKEGPGTMTWTGTNVGPRVQNWFDNLGSPVRINGGTMILKSSDLVGTNAGSPNIVHNGVLLKYDVQPTAAYVTGPETIPGNISGTGPIQIDAGTLILSGQNTLSGNISLTGGELIAGSTENVGVSGPLGQGGTISLNGGTLGWSPANAFDYSSRFDAGAGQVYNLDTGGSSPTFATGLTSSGGSLTKSGGGTLTLAGANSYGGPTTVTVGALVFQGTMSGHGSITVSDGATLGVVENDSRIRPSTLTVGTSTGATLEFNNVTNHTLATLAPTNIASAGTVTINVNSGRFFSIGETFPLLSWTSGSAPAVSLGFLAGAGGHLTTNGNEIDLVIDDPPYIWTSAALDNLWNTSSIDWTRSGSAVAWVNGHFALLDDTAGGGNLAMVGTITPTNATINNSSLAYAITNSAGNVIGGGGSLTKNGNGTLSLPGGANTYSGVTTIGGGVLAASVLANGGAASDIGAASSAATNIVLNGGTLQYTGSGVTVDRLFAVGPNGGTVDSEGAAALIFGSSSPLAMSGNGPRTLTLTGLNSFGDTLASAIVNHPAGTSLAKNGPGTWILTGTNTYAGGSAVLGGTLQVGANGGTGSLGSGNISSVATTTIDFQRTGSLLVPGAISGGAAVVNNGSGTVILANNNTYTGGTTIIAGTLQVGNGGSTGSLNSFSPIFNDSLLVFNTSGTFRYGSGANGIISGTGNVIVQGGGFIKAIGNNTYAGWTRIDPNTTFQPREGQDGLLASSVVTNNGTLRLVTQDDLFTYAGPIRGSGRVQIGANAVNFGVITLTGTNTYSGGTFIGGNTLVLGDGVTPNSGSIAGNVQFVNNFTFAQDSPLTLVFNRPDDFTFSGTITTNFASPQYNRGIVQQNGPGTLTLTGNNTYGSGTVINGGTVQVGNGGTSGTLGFGPVSNNGALIWNRSSNAIFGGVISGSGSLVKQGTGTFTLSAPCTNAGNTTVSVGKLAFQGAKSGTGNIAVADSAALGVTEGSTQVTPNTLTLGGGSGCTLEFDNVTNTTTAPLAANTLSSAGMVTININIGAFTVGQSYPLFSWSSGSAPAVILGSVNGPAGKLSTNGNTIQFNFDGPSPTLIWSGANNGSWDTTTSNNWTLGGSPSTFFNYAQVVFDDTASGTTSLTVNGVVQPALVTVSNDNKIYTIASSGGNNIASYAGLTKGGTNTLSLSGGANAYTGITTLSGGTVTVSKLANGGSASDIGAATASAISLVFDGGTLQYTNGEVNIDRLFTLTTNGGTIDASGVGALGLTSNGLLGYSGNGPRILTLTGSNAGTNTLATPIADNGGATSLTKNGSGKWVLIGNNTYSGVTTINNGVLQIGAGGYSGWLGTNNIINNGVLFFNRLAQLEILVVPNVISGTGSVTTLGIGALGSGLDDITLTGDNTYSGGTTITASRLIVNGKLNANGAITNNGALILANPGSYTLNGVISGTGYVMKYGAGTLTLTANNTYGGGTIVNAGALQVGAGGASGTLGSGSVTDHGQLIFNRTGTLAVGTVTGTGSLRKLASGTVTLTGASSVGGDVDLQAGTFGAAPVGAIGSLSVGGNLTIASGATVLAGLNRSLSPSNSVYTVTGLINYTNGGTLKLINGGPLLQVGDKFTIFNQPVTNLTLVTPGVTVTDNLSVDGSVTVGTVAPPPTITATVSGVGGTTLNLSWPAIWTGGVHLQAQTNAVTKGLSSNWVTIAGTDATNTYSTAINKTNGTVFFRLVSP